MKKRVLFVSHEMVPYLPSTEIGEIARNLPQGIQERGKEIRIFMPRFGCINERRNQLHEVIRLSGMNLVIDDMDHPLIIKVASIQAARMQVYFIDNEDYFKRKAVVTDKDGKFFEDNDERAIFFCQGVIETVKKLGWKPDVVHCHGWMASMLPMYLRTVYKDEPLFSEARIVTSIYNEQLEGELNERMAEKGMMDGVNPQDVELIIPPTHNNLSKLAVKWSDGVIQGSEVMDEEVKSFIDSEDRAFLGYQNPDTYMDEYNAFYDKLMSEASIFED